MELAIKTKPFRDAAREQTSILAPLERAALRGLARRMPVWVNSDHLSILGFVGMLMAGACYAASKQNPLMLHLVNVFVFLNWFGDSLDGTLARYRDRQRPRYGFYVDHIIDTFGALFLLFGIALSGYMSERVAAAVRARPTATLPKAHRSLLAQRPLLTSYQLLPFHMKRDSVGEKKIAD